METSECLKYDLPFANLELYGLSSNPEIYREKALEIAKQFQLDCFKCAYNKNMQIFLLANTRRVLTFCTPHPNFCYKLILVAIEINFLGLSGI